MKAPGATIAVVGGGIAGLSAAWELSGSITSDVRVIVFEAGSQPGGHLRSETIGGRPVDVGPDAFLARRPEAVELCSELGLSETLVAPGSSTAFIWSRNALRRFPAGLVLGVPTRLGPLAKSGIVSASGVARAALDLVLPSPAQPDGSDVSVGEIVTSRLGRQVTESLSGPLVGGINAGRIEDLSSEAVFPALADASRRRGSLMRATTRPRSCRRPTTLPRATRVGASGLSRTAFRHCEPARDTQRRARSTRGGHPLG